MNTTIEIQLNHRSIRKFRDQAISPEVIKTVLKVANQTASSTAAQSFSMIHITCPKKKEAIAEICKQPYVATMPELFIFIVDVYRNARIAMEQGYDLPAKKDMDRFFQGFTDGCIAAQNMVTALESMNFGTVYLGSILNNAEEMIKLLDLPELTFPIVGLGFGYPAEKPALKPRMDLKLKVFENSYQCQENYLEAIKGYDAVMNTYYDLRNESKALPAFSQQIVQRLQNANPLRAALLQAIQKQGFDLNVNASVTQ